MEVRNTLSYYDMKSITAVKGFIVQALGLNVIPLVKLAASPISLSHSQSLSAVWAYSAAGVAWASLAVVTMPGTTHNTKVGS
jgi:hypothetical protein